MVPEPGKGRIGEALVVGTAADIEASPRTAFRVKLPLATTPDKQACKAGAKGYSESLYARPKFCKI